MLTKMTDADWITVLRVFEALRSRRGTRMISPGTMEATVIKKVEPESGGMRQIIISIGLTPLSCIRCII